MGKPGQKVPEMTPEYCKEVSQRYIELYESITGEKFVPADEADLAARIYDNTEKCLAEL